MEGLVVEQVVEESEAVRELLTVLDSRHRLYDTVFGVWCGSLLSVTGGRSASWRARLAPGTSRWSGSWTRVSVSVPCWSRSSCAGLMPAGRVEVTVVLGAEPEGRWRRRMFFEAQGFTSSQGSALHFYRRL